MRARKTEPFKWQMMELSDGITTSNGNWYHITSEQIDKYVPGLLKDHSIEKIIKEADDWVKSADGLSLFFFFILVYFSVTPWLAAVLALSFFWFWYHNTSAFVSPSVNSVISAVGNDGVLYVVSAILLIGISFNEELVDYGIQVEFSALWYGIVLFFLFKVGLLRLLMKFLQAKSPKKGAEMQDRILNMLLIRYGMKSGKLTGNIKKMQDDLIDLANYQKTRKKNK